MAGQPARRRELEELGSFTEEQIENYLIAPATQGVAAAGLAARTGFRKKTILDFLDARPQILLRYAQARVEADARLGPPVRIARAAPPKRDRAREREAAAAAEPLPSEDDLERARAHAEVIRRLSAEREKAKQQSPAPMPNGPA